MGGKWENNGRLMERNAHSSRSHFPHFPEGQTPSPHSQTPSLGRALSRPFMGLHTFVAGVNRCAHRRAGPPPSAFGDPRPRL